MKRILNLIFALSLVAVLAIGCESIINSEMGEQPETSALELDAAKKAGPNAVFALDFSDASDVAENTAASAGWVLDRYNPSLGYPPVSFTQENFDGDDRLRINISETGPTTGFYGYQGKKYLDSDLTPWGAEANARFSYRFYIDPAWETDGEAQQTGVWPTLSTDDGAINAYPIMAYRDSDANPDGGAEFRAYVYETDEDGNLTTASFVSIGIPKKLNIDPEEGGWVTIEAQLHKSENGATLKWRINNKLVLDERNYNYFYNGELYSSMQFHEFIFNSVNYGEDQDYYYDDIMLTNPGN